MVNDADVDSVFLKDQFVRRDIYLGLTKTKLGDPGDGAATLLKHTYGGFLRLKGATSLAKLMSPFTIARNAISAVGFATANGNVGRGANVFESTKIVLNEIRKRNPADRAQYYRMLQEEPNKAPPVCYKMCSDDSVIDNYGEK